MQTAGIVLSLLFTGFSLLRETKSRRLANLLALKQEHRELWGVIHEKPQFARIFEREVDLIRSPMTNDEEVFLRQIIVHFAVGWECIKDGAPVTTDAFQRDVAEFFSLPLPRFALERVRGAQSPDFISFIEGALKQRIRVLGKDG